MSKMLEMWGDSQVVIHLDLVTGNFIEGLVKEVDRNEVVLEPVYEDGTFGPKGNEEWMAFFKDSEGNLVGLVEQRRS